MVGIRVENIPVENTYLVCYNDNVNNDKPLLMKGEYYEQNGEDFNGT